MHSTGDVTRLLSELAAGDRSALDRLMPIVYAELQRVARRQLRAERENHTLDTTALVHEAYLRLSRLDHLRWQNRPQFFAIASQAMRRVLVDYAERRRTRKRGGRWQRVPLDEGIILTDDGREQLLQLDQALQRLAALEPRQSRVVECRFFGGLSVEETAEALDISQATVKRDWSLARAWLNRELAP
ncbi:MAG TPA: ECF-type sigma factor [Gemmatimonadaceae bacterium]|nr:ECF-type sigma factor [Gemmatimonadaceae bacterium]